MKCINTSGIEFKELLEASQLPGFLLEYKISEWQEKNKTDDFPKIEDINNSTEVIDFSKLINENAEPLVNDRTPSVSQSVKVLFNNSEGKITVDQVLNNIVNNTANLTLSSKELITRASKLVSKNKSIIQFVSENDLSNDNTIMEYDHSRNAIRISKSRLQKYDSETSTVAFLHEVVHAQTVDALSKDAKDRTFAEQELVDVVKEFMSKYKNSELANEYGFTNKFEFVAEFYSNPDFRNNVKSLSDKWWNKIMNAIRRLFNIPKNPEFDKLFNTIIDFVEGSNIDFTGIRRFDKVFEKRVEDDSKFASLSDLLTNVISKAQDRIDSAIKQTVSSINNKSTEDKIKHLEITKKLAEDLEMYESSKRWKAIVGYTQAFSKSIDKVDSLLDHMLLNKNLRKDDLVETLGRYKDYLSSYDLMKDIKELATKASLNRLDLSEEDLSDFADVETFLKDAESRHSDIKAKILSIQKEQSVRILSNPIYNTEVETKQRKALTKDYNALQDKGGLTLNEYIANNLNVTNNSDYEADLTSSAEKIVFDPSIDISFMSSWLSDNINTNSRIVQILNNIIIEARDKVIDAFKIGDSKLSKVHSKLIKELGNKKPSVLYKNIIERDSSGKVFLKGEYSIKFKDSFDETMVPIFQEKKELVKTKLGEGLDKNAIKKLAEYRALNKKIATWYKANTIKDETGFSIPHPKYRNKDVTGIEKEMLNEFVSINNDNINRFQGGSTLVSNIAGAKYHAIPTDYKSDLERQLEGDFKGIIKDRWSDATTIRVGDIGIQSKEEAVDASGNIIRYIKPLYRGTINSDEQSLDLATLFKKELFNGLDYESKMKLKPTLGMISDVVKGKDFYKKSTTGGILKNKFASRSPEVTVTGESTELYKRVNGLIERTLYNNFSNYGGTFLGKDINKVTSFINGSAAGLAMSFNIASGVANATNGFTQLFMESIGNDKIKRGTVSKAEAKYTKELLNGNLLKDLTSPHKTSYFNQLLEMFDVMGGLDLTEQESIRNTFMTKFASSKMMNFLNESGEHMMHSVLTEAILDGIKVMNSDNRYIDKDGKITTKEKAASLTDMLFIDTDGILKMSDKVVYSDFNLSTKYSEGGKTHINALVKKKTFDIFGVYDIKFKNELSKHWLGKMTMMFKNFFISGAQYRYTGFSSSAKKQADLSDDELFYNSAEKEYIEGTYTTAARFFINGVIPALKGFQLMYLTENYNSLSEYEKSNLKKATLELALTAIILPAIGMLLGAANDDDDDKLWFAIYINRRVTQELAQFRNPIEAGKMINNPIAGSRFVNNMLNFTYDIITPINMIPNDNESVFGYLDKDSKDNNEMLKHGKKLVPIWSQLDKKYDDLYKLQFGK